MKNNLTSFLKAPLPLKYRVCASQLEGRIRVIMPLPDGCSGAGVALVVLSSNTCPLQLQSNAWHVAEFQVFLESNCMYLTNQCSLCETRKWVLSDEETIFPSV